MQTRTSEEGVDGTPFPPSIMLRYFIWFLPCYDVNIMGYIYKCCCWEPVIPFNMADLFFRFYTFFTIIFGMSKEQ